MEWKKSYKGLVLWLLGFLALTFALPFLPVENGRLLTRITLNLFSLAITLLCWLIYRSGYVYWYNGVTFEEATAAGPLRRKRYAWLHLRLFACAGLLFLIISVIAHLAGIGIWLDLVVFTAALVAAAIRTMWYKL